jgi:hypothetical protein
MTGAWVDGDHNEISFAVGKKWKKHPNIFLHVRYTDYQDTTVVGGTIEF